jgi:hypothetical protein
MRLTDGPMLPMFSTPADIMEVYSVRVAQITGKLQWPLEVYGDVAVRDCLDHKRNYLLRRCRERCQTLTSPQVHSNFICYIHLVLSLHHQLQ